MGKLLELAVQGEHHPALGLPQGVHHLGLLPRNGTPHRVHPVGEGNLPLVPLQHVVHGQLYPCGAVSQAVQVADHMGRQLVFPVAFGHLEHVHPGVLHRRVQGQLEGPAVFQRHCQPVPVPALGGRLQSADGLNGGGHRRHILQLSSHQGDQVAVVNGAPGLGHVQPVKALGPGRRHILVPVVCPGNGHTGGTQQQGEHRRKSVHFFLHKKASFPCVQYGGARAFSCEKPGNFLSVSTCFPIGHKPAIQGHTELDKSFSKERLP